MSDVFFKEMKLFKFVLNWKKSYMQGTVLMSLAIIYLMSSIIQTPEIKISS